MEKFMLKESENVEFLLEEISIHELYYLYGNLPGIKNPAFDFKRFQDLKTIEENILMRRLITKPKSEMSEFEYAQYRVECIGMDITKRGMVNPLAVIKMKPKIYLTTYGNERLCWYRSQCYYGKLECYITEEWGFNKEKLKYKEIDVKGIGIC